MHWGNKAGEVSWGKDFTLKIMSNSNIHHVDTTIMIREIQKEDKLRGKKSQKLDRCESRF